MVDLVVHVDLRNRNAVLLQLGRRGHVLGGELSAMPAPRGVEFNHHDPIALDEAGEVAAIQLDRIDVAVPRALYIRVSVQAPT